MRSFSLLAGPVLLACLAGCNPSATLPLQPLVHTKPISVFLQEERHEAGRSGWLSFSIAENGRPLDAKAESRTVHTVIASEDGKEVFHTPFAESPKAGVFDVPYTFLHPGTFRVWVEVDDERKPSHHGKDADVIAYADVSVDGAAASNAPVLPGGSFIQDGYLVRLEPAILTAGEFTAVRLHLQDMQGKDVPLGDTSGALFAFIGPENSTFEHGHAHYEPLEKSLRLPLKPAVPGRHQLLAQLAFVDGGITHWLDVRLSVDVL
jgi:hypothetical protein